MNNLAEVLKSQGKYEAAEEMHWRELEAFYGRNLGRSAEATPQFF